MVGGTAIGAKVYLRQPEEFRNNCVGCAFCGPTGAKVASVCDVLRSQSFYSGCVGHIWQELKT